MGLAVVCIVVNAFRQWQRVAMGFLSAATLSLHRRPKRKSERFPSLAHAIVSIPDGVL